MSPEEREHLISEAIMLTMEWQYLQQREMEISARRKATVIRLHDEPLDGQRKGMSMRGIAAEMDISYPRVNEIIRGRRPRRHGSAAGDADAGRHDDAAGDADAGRGAGPA